MIDITPENIVFAFLHMYSRIIAYYSAHVYVRIFFVIIRSIIQLAVDYGDDQELCADVQSADNIAR